MSLPGKDVMCGETISLSPQCLVEMDNWRIVLKCLLLCDLLQLSTSFKPSKTGMLLLGETRRLQYMTEFSGLVIVEPEFAPKGGTPEHSQSGSSRKNPTWGSLEES